MFSVIDTNWHEFVGGPDDGTEHCLTCGGTWEYTDKIDPEFPNSIERTYHAADGDAPTTCTGRTNLAHGEAPCENDNGKGCADFIENGTCEHTDFECNCCFCR